MKTATAPGETDIAVYGDVTSKPSVEPDVVSAVDLDLDVVRHCDGTVRVLDEDEFAEHQVRYSYPTEVVEQARITTDDLVARLTAGTEPFATVGLRLAGEVCREPLSGAQGGVVGFSKPGTVVDGRSTNIRLCRGARGAPHTAHSTRHDIATGASDSSGPDDFGRWVRSPGSPVRIRRMTITVNPCTHGHRAWVAL